MSEAMRLIVDGYVRLNDRAALEALRQHRQTAIETLASSPLGVRVMEVNQRDLEIIEAGLLALDNR